MSIPRLVSPTRVPPYTSAEASEIAAQFDGAPVPIASEPTSLAGLTPEIDPGYDPLGTGPSITFSEIPAATRAAFPFANYTGSTINISDSAGFPYYRNLVEKFGQKPPDDTTQRKAFFNIPSNPAAIAAAAPGAPASENEQLATSFDYVGNYFDLLTHMIPDDYKDPTSPQYNPDFHFINLDNASFSKTDILEKPGYVFPGRPAASVPAKATNETHEQYMKKLYDLGLLVLPRKHQSDRGFSRAKRLRYVVQKLFKITIKMDNFSELSEVSRIQQATLEEYALQTRKMFYILTF